MSRKFVILNLIQNLLLFITETLLSTSKDVVDPGSSPG